MSEKSAQADGAGPEGEALAQDFLQRAGIEPPAGGPTPAPKPDDATPAPAAQQPQPLAGEVTVDYGEGVLRNVSVDELVAAHKARGDNASARKALEGLVEEGGLAMKISQRLDELPPERRGQILELLEAPNNGAPRAEPRFEDPANFVDDIMGGLTEETVASMNPEVKTLLTNLTHAVKTLVTDREVDEAQKDRKSLLERVDEKLQSFPAVAALKKMGAHGEYGVSLARQTIVQELTSNPRASLDDLAAAHAAKLNGFTSQLTSSAIETIDPAGDTTPVPGPPPKAEDLTADHLLDGSLRKQLAARFGI